MRCDERCWWSKWLGTPFLYGMIVVPVTAADAPANTPSPPPPVTEVAPAEMKRDAFADKKSAPKKDGRCDLCGSCACVRTVCVPKPKEREIKKTCWSYTCEDVCIPGPSEYCGRRCGKPDECGSWAYDLWKSTCAEVRTKKVPVKTEVIRKMPGVEWKPEERCKACRSRKPGDEVASAEKPSR